MRFARFVMSVTLLASGCQQTTRYDGLDEYARQHLNWYRCGESGLQCTTVDVPLNYDDLSQGSVTLAVNRLPASGSPLGSLFTNPGGPGSSGLDFVANSPDVFATVRTRYDIIGFDPRGIGKSEAVQCFDKKQTAEFLAVDWAPATEEEKERTRAASRAFGQACLERSGRLLPHVGTENVAGDLDLMRRILGDAKLNFLGVSYGSRIGQVYAAHFPQQVGRIVLDSIDPASDIGDTLTDETNLPWLRQLETDLGRYLDDCAAQPACPLGQDRAKALSTLEALWDRLRTDPLKVSNGVLTSSRAREGVLYQVDDPERWPGLSKALAAVEAGDGSPLYELSGGDSAGSPSAALYSVACLIGDAREYYARTPLSLARQVAEKVTQYSAYSPHFGPMIVYSDQVCDYWPVPPTLPAALVKVDDAPPILLVNNVTDMLTTIDDARAVTAELGGSVLLPNNGSGHGVYWNLDNKCARDHIDRYFLEGVLPAPEATC